MSNCDLSVIIPIYNGERFLRDTLNSVLSQTYRDFELILVDDGSTDHTPEICDEYAERDNRIKVCHQKNGGMSQARDVGYQMALPNTSIAFLDGDDIFEPRMFEDMMMHKESDLVYTCFTNVLSAKILEYEFKDEEDNDIEEMSGKEMLDRLFTPSKNQGNMGCLWGMLIKREFYQKMEPLIRKAQDILPQNYLNDVYCIPRFLCNAEHVVLLNKVYVLHRVSPYTDSRLLKPNALHYELALANKMNLDYYEENHCEYAYEKQIVGFYLTILKLWYQIVTEETDLQKKEQYIKQIQQYYADYYDKLKAVTCNSIGDRMVKWSIMIFKKSNWLWKVLVGNIRYGIMYRF